MFCLLAKKVCSKFFEQIKIKTRQRWTKPRRSPQKSKDHSPDGKPEKRGANKKDKSCMTRLACPIKRYFTAILFQIKNQKSSISPELSIKPKPATRHGQGADQNLSAEDSSIVNLSSMFKADPADSPRPIFSSTPQIMPFGIFPCRNFPLASFIEISIGHFPHGHSGVLHFHQHLFLRPTKAPRSTPKPRILTTLIRKTDLTRQSARLGASF